MKKMTTMARMMMVMVFSTGQVYGATTGVAVFNHSTGARQLGMADVAVGIADDANAVFYNPAGIARVKALELNAVYFDNIVDTKDEAIAVSYPLRKGLFGKSAALGLGIKAYQGGDIDVIEFDTVNNVITSQKTMSAESDYMIGVTYAEKIASKLSAGITLKAIHSTLVEDYTASAIAADIGLLYETPIKGLDAGLSLLNSGTKMKFISEGDSLPQRLVVGLGYGFKPAPMAAVKVGIDIIDEKDADTATNLGVEVTLLNMVALRAGYLTNSDLGSVTAGIGIKMGMFQLDYGYGMFDELNDLQKVSLTVRWDAPKRESQVKKRVKKRIVRKRIIRRKVKKSPKKTLKKTSTKSSKRYSITKK